MANANIKIDYSVVFDQLTKSREELTRLEKQTVKNEKEAENLRNELNKLNTQSKASSTGFSNMKSTLMSLGSAFGIAGGIAIFANAVKNAAKTVVDFQKQNSILAGVIGTTRDGVKALTDDAKRLGGTTVKSASEVTQLQIALARLGFTQKEIIDLSPALINGSIALNSELDQTAELVGSVVKSFDEFATTDATDIVDQLTASTQRSALSFEKLSSALPIIGGAANAAGVPFNELLSLLGSLSDAGMNASSSATALKNIFIISAKTGISYADSLNKIATSQDKLSTAANIFGLEAATQSVILANTIGKTAELADKIADAGGTAQRVADENMTTLANRIALMASAYEAFIFSVDQGDGILSNIAKSFIDGISDVLTILSALNDGTINFGQALAGLTSPTQKNIILFQIQAKTATDAAIKQHEAAEGNEHAMKRYNQALKEGITTHEEFVGWLSQTYDETFANTDQNLLIQGLFNKGVKDGTDNIIKQGSVIGNINEKIKKLNELKLAANSPAQISAYNIQIALYKEELKLLDELGVAHMDFQAIKNRGLKNDVTEQSKALKGFADTYLFQNVKSVEEGNKAMLKNVAATIKDQNKQRENEQEDALKREEFEFQRQEELTAAKFQLAGQAANTFADIRIGNLQRELQELEAQKDREIELAGDNEEKKAAIEKRFAIASAKIKEQQFKADRIAGISSIIINTAQGVTKALSDANIPLSIIIGALGGLQLATALATPIPKFEKGGMIGGKRHSAGGTILEAEQGEYILNRKAVEKYGIRNIEKINNMDFTPNLMVINDNKELVKALTDKPNVSLNWDENGFTSYMNRKNQKITRKQKRFSMA